MSVFIKAIISKIISVPVIIYCYLNYGFEIGVMVGIISITFDISFAFYSILEKINKL